MTEMTNRPDSAENGVYILPFEYNDPHCNEKFDEINDMVSELGRIGTRYYEEQGLPTDLTRKRKSDIDKDNPATRALMQELPSVDAWLATIPTAAALHPLYQPEASRLPNGTELDPKIPDWFKNIADARGIRSRAEAMKSILHEHATQDEAQQQWLSLACGAAQPIFSVLGELKKENARLPIVTLADKDKNALALARGYAEENSLGEQIATKDLNVLLRKGLSYRRGETLKDYAASSLLRMRGRLPAESYDAVDAVGILEYLGQEDWKYTYNGVISSSTILAGARTFMHNAYDLVKPGGVLVVGNMLDDHPQRDFTLNVIQWPHIQPRSVDEMMDIIKGAGITGEVEVHMPSDGVYAIYGIRKPE